MKVTGRNKNIRRLFFVGKFRHFYFPFNIFSFFLFNYFIHYNYYLL